MRNIRYARYTINGVGLNLAETGAGDWPIEERYSPRVLCARAKMRVGWGDEKAARDGACDRAVLKVKEEPPPPAPAPASGRGGLEKKEFREEGV